MNINLKEENDKLKTWMIQMTLDTVFFLSSIYVLKFQKIYFLIEGLWEYLYHRT